MNNRFLFSVMAWMASLMVFAGCSGSGLACNWTGEVEIAPGEWLSLEGEESRAWFSCRWDEKEVYWPGDYSRGGNGYYDRHIPVSLRSWKGSLYLIYQWTDKTDEFIKFAYCKLDKLGTRFEEVGRANFLRQIATQNIGLHQEGVAHDDSGTPIDRLKIIRELNVKHPAFDGTTTSRIWYHLEKGLRVQEVVDSPAEATVFFAGFVDKYHPIALPTLVR